MAKKKTSRKKKVAGKKKPAAKKPVAKKRVAATRKNAARGKVVRAKKPARKKAEPRSPIPSTLDGDTFVRARRPERRGLGSNAAGQSGDTQGLRRGESADSESVEELAEEGQGFEAEAVSGVEDALDPDQGEVRTHEVPEDDVPSEYTDKD